MLHGKYIRKGPDVHLRLKGAILRGDPNNPDNYLAQFDDLDLKEAYNWHPFNKKLFFKLEFMDYKEREKIQKEICNKITDECPIEALLEFFFVHQMEAIEELSDDELEDKYRELFK